MWSKTTNALNQRMHADMTMTAVSQIAQNIARSHLGNVFLMIKRPYNALDRQIVKIRTSTVVGVESHRKHSVVHAVRIRYL